MIHVIAELEVKPGKLDEFLVEFNKIVPEVLAEKGCLEYGPATDFASGLEVQSSVRENLVVVVEKWEDVPSWDAHIQAPHMAKFREAVADIMAGAKIYALEPRN